jgi:hypothetical protein
MVQGTNQIKVAIPKRFKSKIKKIVAGFAITEFKHSNAGWSREFATLFCLSVRHYRHRKSTTKSEELKRLIFRIQLVVERLFGFFY